MSRLADRVAVAVQSHPVDDVEAAVVAAFCRANDLSPAAGTLAAQACRTPVDAGLALLVDGAGAAVPGEPGVVVDSAVRAGVSGWTLDALVGAFETLLEPTVAAAGGAVFTPEPITAFMAAQLCDRATGRGVDLAEATVVDPAAGCGALLVAMIAELVDRTGQQPHQVASRVHGVDIDADSVRRARLLIELCCLVLGDPVAPDPQLRVADALADHGRAPVQRHQLVIANPPYVRYQDLPEDRRADLADRFASCRSGNYNLYFAFFEVFADLVASDGVVAVIAPNGWFTSFAAGALRSWSATTRQLDTVVDFGHHRVFNAMTYTAITFATPKPDTDDAPGGAADGEPGFCYVDVDGLADLATLAGSRAWESGRGTPVPWATVAADRWQLVGPRRHDLISTIAATGRPLAEVAEVRFGVATCRDNLFRLDGTRDDQGRYLARFADQVWPIEAEVTRRCVKVSGVTSQQQLDSYPGRILYPYRVADGMATVLEESTLAEEFPGAYAYLCAIREDLAQRDRGRKTYAAWFAYGRTQGLVPYGPKLLTPLYAGSPRFLLEDDPDSLFLNGCSVVPSAAGTAAGVDVETLGWVLNSSVCRAYVEATSNAISNGFFAYQKKQLAGFGVPLLSAGQRAELRRAGSQAEVDDLVAAAYGVVVPEEFARR